MAFSEATALELRHRPIEWFVTIMLAAFAAVKQDRLCKHFVDVLCIVFPVRGNVQCATFRQAICT